MGREVEMTKLWAIGIVFLAAIIGSFGALFLKIGARRFSFKFKRLIKNYKLIFGVLLYAISSMFFIWGLKHGELSVLYPIVATGYIWICLLSVKVLKEKMNIWRWLGILAILIGVSLIGFGS